MAESMTRSSKRRIGSLVVAFSVAIVFLVITSTISVVMSGISSAATRVSTTTLLSSSSSSTHIFYPMVTAFVPPSLTVRQRTKSCQAFCTRIHRNRHKHGIVAKSPKPQWLSSAAGGSRIEPGPASPHKRKLAVSGGWNRYFSSDSITVPTSLSASTSDTNDEQPERAASSSSFMNSVQEQYCNSRLMFLRDEMIQLAGDNKDFNANSPAQRSMAIFGDVRSCPKKVLLEISEPSSTSSLSEHKNLPESKRLLAKYILEFQELSKLQQMENKPQEKEKVKDSQQEVSTSNTVDAKDNNRTKAQRKLDTEAEPQIATPTEPSQHPEPETLIKSASPPKAPKSEPIVTTPPAVRMGGSMGRKRQPRRRPATHDEVVEGLFANPTSSKLIDPYWNEPLLELSRPVARDLVKQLDPNLCPMGYNPGWMAANHLSKKKTKSPTRGKRVGFLGYCRDQKELFPQHVVLVRCGDFYETFGMDAILLVEHVGLNPMGGKARSGCPKQNIHATLDGLTAQGFSVVVYEELEPVVGTTRKLKERFLAQIVSPAAPTYLYDNWLLGGSTNGGGSGGEASASTNNACYSLDGLPPPRPCVGVVHTAAGYSIVEVSLEERSVQYSERLTAEAVACRLAAYPPADPLVYIPSQSEQEKGGSATTRPSFLPRGGDKGSGRGRLRTKILGPDLVPEPSPGKSDADRYIHAIVDTILKTNELQPAANGNTSNDEEKTSTRCASVNDFTITMASTSTNPLYVETATQIGLMDDKTIPSLIRHVLDDAAPAVTRRFLHRYLLIPPPPSVARSMACVVETLMDENIAISLPPLTVPTLGKSISLIRAGQAGAGVYGELLQSLDTTMYVLEHGEGDVIDLDDDEFVDPFVESLLHICQYESGLPATRKSLLERCGNAVAAIEAVVSSSYHVEENYERMETSPQDVVNQDDYIPIEFFERNEKSWRGRVQQSVAENAYQRVKNAAEELSRTIRDDFIGTSDSNKALIKYIVFDNLIALNKIPSDGFDKEMAFVHPNDRFGKVLSNRWTTEKVKKAVSHYVSECDYATNEVASILTALAQDLQDDGHIPAIVQSSHFNLVISTAFHHAVKATNSKWELAQIIEDGHPSLSTGANIFPAWMYKSNSITNFSSKWQLDDTIEAGDNYSSSSEGGTHFLDVFPYWMHKSKAVTNTFDLSSMILLTAPNMSGKSTLMRSTAAAALLTVCGLCAPLSSDSRIPRFDTLFLRGASADVPTENKSAFGAEMGDLAALFRCSGEKSLVFVDELGRGTSPKDGTRLAGAVLEKMAESGMSGIFATHLHDVLELPLNRDRIFTKRIRIDPQQSASDCQWSHKLEDGMCKDSMALVTAERFGLPDEIISRARELSAFLPENSPPPITIENCDNDDDDVAYSENYDVSKRSKETTTHQMDDVLHDTSLTELQKENLKHELQKELNNVIDVAYEMILVDNDKESSRGEADDGEIAKTVFSFFEVPPRHHPPASLSNRSCLYVLQLTPQGSSPTSTTTARYYVGETDSISRRLAQHRKKGSLWKSARAVVFPLANKSQARFYESALIRSLVKEGYSLESIEDGRTLRRFRE